MSNSTEKVTVNMGNKEIVQEYISWLESEVKRLEALQSQPSTHFELPESDDSVIVFGGEIEPPPPASTGGELVDRIQDEIDALKMNVSTKFQSQDEAESLMGVLRDCLGALSDGVVISRECAERSKVRAYRDKSGYLTTDQGWKNAHWDEAELDKALGGPDESGK